MTPGTEIERKFLLAKPPEDLEQHPAESIEQGYLAITETLEVRIRQKGHRRFLTIKSSGDRTRLEEEIEIDERRFQALWPLTQGQRLQKTRYRMPSGSVTIEVDVYSGGLHGLIVAEVEFSSEAACEAFEPPTWFGREVSAHAAFRNQTLAVSGLPEEE